MDSVGNVAAGPEASVGEVCGSGVAGQSGGEVPASAPPVSPGPGDAGMRGCGPGAGGKAFAESEGVRVFPRWLSRRFPFLAEVEANPLYGLLTERRYGRRRWWLLGRRGSALSTSRRSLAFRIGVPVVVLAGFAMLSTGVGAGLGLLLLLLGTIGALGLFRKASVASFLKQEREAGRLEALLLTDLTSREWAVGWLGGQVFRRPRVTCVMVLLILSFWPVICVCLALSGNLKPMDAEILAFILCPSMLITAMVVQAMAYQLGSSVMNLSFELDQITKSTGVGDAVSTAVGTALAGGLFFVMAWLFPALPAVLAGHVAMAVLEGGGVSGVEWLAVGAYATGLSSYLAVSLLIQWGVARDTWKNVQVQFLPAVRQFAETWGRGRIEG